MKTAERLKVEFIKSVAPQWLQPGALLDFNTGVRTLDLVEENPKFNGQWTVSRWSWSNLTCSHWTVRRYWPIWMCKADRICPSVMRLALFCSLFFLTLPAVPSTTCYWHISSLHACCHNPILDFQNGNIYSIQCMCIFGNIIMHKKNLWVGSEFGFSFTKF